MNSTIWMEGVVRSMLYSIVLGAILTALLLIIRMIFSKLSSKRLFSIFFIGMILLLIGSVFMTLMQVESSAVATSSQAENAVHSASNFSSYAIQFVFWFYVAGVCARVIYLFSGLHSINRLKKENLHSIPDDWKSVWVQVQNKIHLQSARKVRFYLAEKITSPMTMGFLKPVILVPFSMLAQIDLAQLEAILLHELSHIKRKDYLLNLIQQFSICILFFNPFIWIIARVLEQERENACDDAVLHQQVEPTFYANTLIQIALFEKEISKQAMSLAYSGSSSSQLINRVRRILKIETKPKRLFPLISLLIIVLLGLFTFSNYHLTKKSQAKLPQVDNRMRILFDHADGGQHWVLLDSIIILSTKIGDSRQWKEHELGTLLQKNPIFFNSPSNWTRFQAMQDLIMEARTNGGSHQQHGPKQISNY